MTLDAAFFPHIIDEIFAYAPPASLLALRANKARRQRAESQLPYHVLVNHSQSALGHYTIVRAQRRQPPSWKISASINPSFLAATRVVDLDVHWVDFKFPHMLFKHCAPQVSFRCRHRCYLKGLSSSNAHQLSCLVLFANDVVGYHSLSYFAEYQLFALKQPKKLVLHLRDKGMDSKKQARNFSLGGVTSLTLILHPKRLDASRPILTFQLGLLIDLVMLGYVHGVPVTVVGLHFPHFEARHPEMAGIKDQVAAEVTRIRPEYESLCKGSTTLDVCYLSRGEYRDKVGEAQYKIETVEGSIARPTLTPAT